MRVVQPERQRGEDEQRPEHPVRDELPAASRSDVLSAGETDDVIGKMRVAAVLESLPGVGKARAAKIMERLDISPTRRIRGLGAKQRSALEHEFGSGDSAGR